MTDFQHCRLHSNSWSGDAGCLVPSCLLEPRSGALWFSGSTIYRDGAQAHLEVRA